MRMPRYVLIANPGTKRCETYRRELLAFWADRGATPEVEVRGFCSRGVQEKIPTSHPAGNSMTRVNSSALNTSAHFG